MSTQDQMKIVHEIVNNAIDYIESNPGYLGLLLCEGTPTSLDIKLYRKVYPKLHVLPAGGCSDIQRMLQSVKKRMRGYPTFGIIDRDARTKYEVRKLSKRGIFCTKLPFIENIISSPEIVRLLGKYKGINIDEGIEKVQDKLLMLLSSSLRDTLPVNISHPPEQKVSSITFTIKLENGQVIEKTVSSSNIIYAYRDKAVANETADIFGIIGRRRYYKFFEECLEDPVLCEKILKCAKTYLPDIEMKLNEELSKSKGITNDSN